MTNKTKDKALHIGIDFDNTIISYDKVFHKYATKLGLIGPEVERNKQAIRDAIRRLPNGNDQWTELQGLVYGKHVDEADIAPGFDEFIDWCRTRGIKLSIISHKTIYPAMGPQYNLHTAAQKWLEDNDLYERTGIAKDDVIFEEKLQSKLSQIGARGCTHFIDDLPEVLLHSDFPAQVKKILYSQEKRVDGNLLCFRSWHEIKNYFLDQ